MATAVAPPSTPATSTSVDPLYTQALAQAKAALAAEQAPVQAQQASSDAQYAQRQTDATGVAAALSKLLQPIGPAVNDMYQTAGQNQELAANGFSHGMQDALQGNTDNLNAMLAKLGQSVKLDSHAGEAGDVLYGLGGYNPGTSFSKAGAAFGSAAELQAGDALLAGQENVKSLQAKAIVADQGFQAKLSEMAGKLPGNVETNYQKLQTLALNDKKFALSVQHENFSEAAKIADQKFNYGKYVTSVQEFNARFAQTQTQQNRMYTVALENLGIRQTDLQMKIAAAAFKSANGGYTAADITKFTTKLDALAAAGAPTRPGTQTFTNGNGGTSTTTGAVQPTPQYLDKSGKWHDIGPNTPVPKGAQIRNNNTYANFIGAALKKGVPIQMAIDRANTLWPETQRALPPGLQSITAAASEAAQQMQSYNQMTGSVGAANGKGQVVLGTSPQGQQVILQMPKNATPAMQKIIGGAVEYLGTPYAWGGTSPNGFDCSGLAQYLYAKVGIQIPRTTYDQFKGGLSVPQNQLQAGDLVFFKGGDSQGGLPGHVGIYVGNGMMIDAPHPGSVVRVESVRSFGGYQGARRYVH